MIEPNDVTYPRGPTACVQSLHFYARWIEALEHTSRDGVDSMLLQDEVRTVRGSHSGDLTSVNLRTILSLGGKTLAQVSSSLM
jgi:hypothetical protein